MIGGNLNNDRGSEATEGIIGIPTELGPTEELSSGIIPSTDRGSEATEGSVPRELEGIMTEYVI